MQMSFSATVQAPQETAWHIQRVLPKLKDHYEHEGTRGTCVLDWQMFILPEII